MVERKYMTRDICLHNFKFLPCSVCPHRALEKGRGEKDRGGRGGRGGDSRWVPRSSAKKIGRDRERADRDRRAYRRNDRRVMKFGGEVEHDTRHLPAQFQFPPSLRLPVPSLGKRPRGKTEGAAAIEADGDRGPRREKTGSGEIGPGEPIERVEGTE